MPKIIKNTVFSGTKRNFSSFGRPAFLGSQNEKLSIRKYDPVQSLVRIEFITGFFSYENSGRPLRTPPLRGHPDYGGKRFSGKKRPVKRNTFGGKETIN